MFSKNVSNYAESLDEVSRGRYKDKVRLINDVDPYKIPKAEWSQDVDKWADVDYPDIVCFLLYTTSAYSLDELRAYKSLEAYNQFISGWVRDVSVSIINNHHVHIGRVLHSQRLNETALTTWMIIQPDGKVLAAHCNCMAGLGEICTHVAALPVSVEKCPQILTDLKSEDLYGKYPQRSFEALPECDDIRIT